MLLFGTRTLPITGRQTRHPTTKLHYWFNFNARHLYDEHISITGIQTLHPIQTNHNIKAPWESRPTAQIPPSACPSTVWYDSDEGLKPDGFRGNGSTYDYTHSPDNWKIYFNVLTLHKTLLNQKWSKRVNKTFWQPA